ncbi:DNA cytosine methyltransferase [Gloeobacter kilaueensis]|uniref:Cytosine-specific methyltransferase n=1 Tax=Gloeobacter kilaueensis (strain ATCC BAA-2537 / CCAP 1431/1 / ULC 316 / JS1) TaxID=1183438 RepID=U5QJX9_GLOK1|nr:DNA cytosine methyltransferase [Gloeobacter kilaueensis]AGY59231.1 DNA-cytosine methyltransferase [Gloeobacter kilaueensis JS1]
MNLSPSSQQPEIFFAEFFCGIGLVRLGLERVKEVRFQCVFANDIDPEKGEIYRNNFRAEHLLIADVAQVQGEDVPPGVDFVTASFPCIDLSLAGKRRGLAGQHSSAFYRFLNVLDQLAEKGRLPKVIMLENVVGLLTSHCGADIRAVLSSLNERGYACDLLLIDAVHFLPQSRPRVYLTAFQNALLARCDGLGTDKLLDVASQSHPCRTRAVLKVILDNPDLFWHFMQLPSLKNCRTKSLADIVETDADHRWFNQQELERELAYVRNGSCERLHKAQRNARQSGNIVYLTAYRRMRSGLVCLETRDDGIAGCLRTPVGGSSRQVLIAVQPDGTIHMRYMSVREYARLQGADGFLLPASQHIGLKAFGDAVAVPVVEWLGRAIAKYLAVNAQSGILLDVVTEVVINY